MVDDAHLDGNALGGLFIELFGREMTDEVGCCDHCGSVNAFGTLMAYVDAPGAVVRCPRCGAVQLVAVSVPAGLRVSFASIRWVQVGHG
jgi:Family of unknown function (DUF6510)